jgi:hypothetical protein
MLFVFLGNGFFEGQMSKNTGQVGLFCLTLLDIYSKTSVLHMKNMKNPAPYCFFTIFLQLEAMGRASFLIQFIC